VQHLARKTPAFTLHSLCVYVHLCILYVHMWVHVCVCVCVWCGVCLCVRVRMRVCMQTHLLDLILMSRLFLSSLPSLYQRKAGPGLPSGTSQRSCSFSPSVTH